MIVSSHKSLETKRAAQLLARDHQIFIGCASHVLGVTGNEHSAHSLRDYARTLPTIEITVRLAQLPDLTFLRTVQNILSLVPIWRVTICDFEEEKHYFEREPFFHFVRALQRVPASNALIVSLERSSAYDTKHLDYLLDLRESLSPFAIHFELEHHSWSHAALDLRSARASIVQHDSPELPGIVKEIRVPGRNPIVRLLGRNKRAWFEHHPNERFEYSYTANELEVIANRIRALKDDSDTIRIIVATHPASSALEAAHTLTALLSK